MSLPDAATSPESVPADRPLGSYRERIDAVLASLTIERREARRFEADGTRAVPYDRRDIWISGTVDGYVVKQGQVPASADDAYSWLHDTPDLTLPQEHFLTVDRLQPYPLPIRPGDGNTHPRFYARAEFKAEDGAGISLLLPDRDVWNGKLFIVQHGSGVYVPLGELAERQREGFTQGTGRNLFAGVFLGLGYAVAWFRRDAARPPVGTSWATLEDGSRVRTTFVASAAHALAMVELCQRAMTNVYGQPAKRTYWYGHSGGGIAGRLLNYSPGANQKADGSPIVDGFLDDDAGNGLYMPVMIQGGQDVLLRDEADRERFRPQMDLVRQAYNPRSYLAAKRYNADLLRQKGVGHKHRSYEVRGVSHFDAGQVNTFFQGDAVALGGPRAIDLGGVIEALAMALDAWVEQGVEPPASRADAPGEVPAVDLPETACPLGVYYSGAAGATGNMSAMATGFAPFDGASPEPVSADTGDFLDVNGNGQRDSMETVDAAWRRLGLLNEGEAFTPERYAAAVGEAANRLVQDRLLPERVAAWYRAEAERALRQSGARWGQA